MLFLKNSLNNFFTSLLEITGTDLNNLYNFNFLINTNTSNTKLIQYNIINYTTSYRLLCNIFINNNQLYSLETLYNNSNWMERELIEFLGINFINKLDTRNLLLDYNILINPLLKNFPVEGIQELYYNFQTNTLDYINTEFIEL